MRARKTFNVVDPVSFFFYFNASIEPANENLVEGKYFKAENFPSDFVM